ncbi:MAG: hypothetical protein FWG52_08295 [Proteobacteria bacterium]|nr:hypothetical protein [Pseudomonadota bacterium]
MRNKQRLMIAFLLVVSFLSGIAAVMLYPFNVSQNSVTIDVRDMRYACGDCFVRFGVINTYDEGGKIIDNFEDTDSRSLYRFNGWDIIIVYKGNSNFLQSYQEELYQKDEYCSWPVFRLKGQFKRKLINNLIWEGNGYDGLYFDATSGVSINNDPECKAVPQETMLP